MLEPHATARQEVLGAAIADVILNPSQEPSARWTEMEPCPFYAWLIVCLMRQLVRQHWLVRVRDEHLSATDVQDGEVPGLPGWRYDFHGRGLCLSGPGEESLDVDFYEESGSVIDPYFFAHRVHALASPALPEARLRAQLPSTELIARAIRQLLTAPVLLLPQEGGHVFRLAPALEQLAAAAAALPDTAWQARAAWLGDCDEEQDPDGRGRAARKAWLLDILYSDDHPWQALPPLADLLPPSAFAPLCTQLLDEQPVGTFSAKLVLQLETMPAELANAAVLRLLPRLSEKEHHPYPAWATVRYLLRRGLAREEARKTLLAFGRVEQVKGYRSNPFLSELAELALLHAPAQSLELVRRALRYGAPATQVRMAAVLAALDRPWCWRELRAALADTDELEKGLYLCEALVSSTDGEAKTAAARWLQTHPPAPHQGIGFTWEEVLSANSNHWFADALAEAKTWAAALPPESIPETL